MPQRLINDDCLKLHSQALFGISQNHITTIHFNENNALTDSLHQHMPMNQNESHTIIHYKSSRFYEMNIDVYMD